MKSEESFVPKSFRLFGENGKQEYCRITGIQNFKNFSSTYNSIRRYTAVQTNITLGYHILWIQGRYDAP